MLEARIATGSASATIEEMGGGLAKDLLAAVLVTRGADGMTLFRDGCDSVHLPARAQHVYDVTGAGDTVAATVAVGLGHGLDLPDACWMANEAAAIAVSRRGTTVVTRDDLRAATDT
jgi:D-beta-D-heptose 7-phosphate kinase/D-beta-D-heptose 1-phosphate adenosyltransferase